MIPSRERPVDLTIREEPPWLVLGVLGHPSDGKGAQMHPQDHPAARQEGVPPSTTVTGSYGEVKRSRIPGTS